MSALPLEGGKEKWTLGHGIAECKRELGLRKRVYPSFVARGSMGTHEAEYHTWAMEGVLRFLQFCQEKEPALRQALIEDLDRNASEDAAVLDRPDGRITPKLWSVKRLAQRWCFSQSKVRSLIRSGRLAHVRFEGM